jgi:HlyD family secretion protein
MRKLAAIVVMIAAVAGALWWLTRPEAVSVATVKVDRGPVTATIANTRAGTVDACRRAGIAPAMGGQISRLAVADGDLVETGEVLLELWNEDIRAELELARRDAQAADSRRREACIIAGVAEREATRMMRLREQGLASEEIAERAVGNAESTDAACTAANDLARVAAARVDVVTAQLERTLLRAPFAGVVAEINGELGEFVTPSPVGIPTPPTVDIIDTSCLYISAPIDEVDAPFAKPGLPARISLDAFPDRSFLGEVRRVAPYVLDLERQARTVEIEAEIIDAEGTGLLPGYSADVEIILDARESTLRVPTSTVLPDDTVFVWDPATGLIEQRAIERGISNWEFTEIVSGLSDGEILVSSIDRDGVADGAVAQAE